MKNIFTIPNIISLFRLALIPVFVVLYFSEHYDFWAVIVIALSALSDVADGFIARHFNMVSDLGKILDPIADKLTQAVLLMSLSIRHFEIFPMFAVLFIKELLTLFVAAYLLTHGTKPISSKWFGKLSTAVIFLTMFYTLIIDLVAAPQTVLYILIGASIVCMIISMLGYFRIFSKDVKGEKIKDETV